MKTHRKPHSLTRLPLIVAMLGCLYGVSAQAQEATDQTPASDETREKSNKDLGTITVTGSLLRRVEYDTAAPVQVITADTNIAAGQVDVAEFLQTSSVAAGSTQISNQFSSFVTEGGIGTQTVSLRGMGANRSLVLLNGNRPGPAGTRGQVGAFDLNVIPQAILQRAEVLKDGSSSIYGSDAVAGVVNLITRKNISRPEVSFMVRAPQHGGGESYDLSGAFGWNLGSGNIALAASYYQQQPLKVKDRDFFRCPRDMYWDDYGNRLDRADTSINAGTAYEGCQGSLYNAVIDANTGIRYVPSTDGSTVGPIPGYRPRTRTTYANSPKASTDEVIYGDWQEEDNIIASTRRYSLYGSSDFNFSNGLAWTSEVLLNRRETQARSFRQFFPLIGSDYANSPGYKAPVPSGLAMPVMPFRMDNNIKVDFYYLNTALEGDLPFADWTWKANTSYSRSKGSYSSLNIRASASGDAEYSDTAPSLDYFDPGFLSGRRMDELVNALGVWDKGVTIYDQFVFNAVATGELFQLPAGAVGAAVGAEYRRYSIDDQPGALSRNADSWGLTSASVTKGKDNVKELFFETEIPLLKGKPAVESLTLNLSARAFDYDSLKDNDKVWKLGLNWQVIPSLRLRATKGTSFRAPGLYELYLGNQSGFQGQRAIDPCIEWRDSTNEYVRANCAAAGIPDDYAGASSSATVYTGGGAGLLRPETSKAFTAGFVWTPSFAPLSVALDYFNYEVIDQISELKANSILAGCYGSPVYPNEFCSRFDRNPANHGTAPHKIETVRASYININRQQVRGYDLLARYENDYSFGKLDIEASVSYLLEDAYQTFSSASASGYETNDYVGNIARPRTVGNIRTNFKRNDWSYTWSMDYVGGTDAIFRKPVVDYYRFKNANRNISLAARMYHTASVMYSADKWSMLFGVRNVFDTTPPTISSGATTRYGNIPAFATQYDWLGRTFFARFNYKF